MNFNVEKCKTLHVGANNDRVNYSVNGVQLSEVDQEKGLEIIISNDLKPNLQYKEAIKKANKLIGFTGRTFKYKPEKSSALYVIDSYGRILNTVYSYGAHIIERI